MGYQELIVEDQRRVILDALHTDADYSHNDEILRSILGHFGHVVSHDKMRTELAWLSEQGLVEVTELGSVAIVKLTRRGSDVASGAVTIPGVKKPRL